MSMADANPTLILTIDLDKLEIGAGIAGLSSPLQKLIKQAPPGTQAALAWLPDLSLSEAQTLLSIQNGDLGAYVVVADADGNPLASTFVFVKQATDGPEAVIRLALDTTVDLAATPLFGTLLSGVRITDLAVSYASTSFAPADIVLPAGAPTPPSIPSGLGLSTTVDANGSAQMFELPTPSAAASARPLADRADASGTPSVTWFDVQKSLGPLTVDRVGVTAAGGTLGLALDASLDTDVVSIQLTGFTVAFAPGAMASSPPSVSLDGLAVSVSADPLEIDGALLHTHGPDGSDEYDGALLIRAGSYAINAAGSYTVLAGAPSLFVFGVAEGTFGGPPAFFVTGLAAGFGVNRALRLPSIDQLATYPLIEAAADTSAVATGTQGTQDALAQLNSGGWVPPTLGEYWVAAGVKFRSFEIVDGFALATVEFGKELVIALLGLATLQLPTAADTGPDGPVYAYVEVALEAVLRPQDGVLTIEALLTPNSYVIDPACHLTGGLAFYLWFGSNQYAGDFVFTLGGYSPLFNVPAWYPVVPRLGFFWQIGDTIQVSGQAYFAWTPSAIMGGGRLSATFEAGGLRAWFIAQLDFIVSWRPFFYDFETSISIGVSYTGTVVFVSGTFTVELGVSVHLWGPPLRGLAHVDWWVISFDIPINIPSGGSTSPPSNATTLKDWPTFATASLPQGGPCRARPASGLQSIVTTTTAAGTVGETIWLFSGDTLGLATESAIPLSQAAIAGPEPTTLTGPPVNVYPLAAGTSVTVTQQVYVAQWNTATWQPGSPLPAGIDVHEWGWASVAGQLPAALWGARGSEPQPSADAKATVAAVTGVTGTGQVRLPVGLPLQPGSLLIGPLPTRGLVLGAGPAGGPGPARAGDTRSQVAATINETAVAALRGAVLTVASGSGLGADLTAGPLPLLASETNAVLTSQPMLGSPGTTGPPAAAAGPAAAAQAATGVTGVTAAESPLPPVPAPPVSARPALRALFGRASAVVADRWSTSAEARLLAAADVRVIRPGTMGVWDLADEGARTLRGQTAAPLWVVALDPEQRPAQTWVEPAASLIQEVPSGTARVAVTALAGRAGGGGAGGVAGWHGGSGLRQIASQVLLGDGVVIRPQSPAWLPRRRSRRASRVYRELGVTTGRDMVERTWTQGMGGRLERGWIETYLPSWCRVVVVGVRPEGRLAGQDEPPTPTVTVGRLTAGEPWPTTGERAAARLGDPAGAGLVLWSCQVPAGETGGGQVMVRTAAPDGWRLDGVHGFEAAPGSLDRWPLAQADSDQAAATTPARVWWE
jgi:hypothetical protein